MVEACIQSSEMDLILLLTEDIYKKPRLEWPDEIDWHVLEKLAERNKIRYHTLLEITEDKKVNKRYDIPEFITELAESEKENDAILMKTIRVVDDIVGYGNYLLSKTYRGYPYVTHDVDIIVKDLMEFSERIPKFEKKGFILDESIFPNNFDLIKEGYMEVEVYTRPSPGPMIFMDDDLPWKNSRVQMIEGIKTDLPGVESEILAFLSDMNFRMYEILLGEIPYLFSISPQADWNLIAEQAEKYNWYGAFEKTIALFNGFHHAIYDEASVMEEYFPVSADVEIDFPFVLPQLQVSKALVKKDLNNILKIPSYYSIRLKKFRPKVYKIYSKVFNYLTRPAVRYLYHRGTPAYKKVK